MKKFTATMMLIITLFLLTGCDEEAAKVADINDENKIGHPYTLLQDKINPNEAKAITNDITNALVNSDSFVALYLQPDSKKNTFKLEDSPMLGTIAYSAIGDIDICTLFYKDVTINGDWKLYGVKNGGRTANNIYAGSVVMKFDRKAKAKVFSLKSTAVDTYISENKTAGITFDASRFQMGHTYDFSVGFIVLVSRYTNQLLGGGNRNPAEFSYDNRLSNVLRVSISDKQPVQVKPVPNQVWVHNDKGQEVQVLGI